MNGCGGQRQCELVPAGSDNRLAGFNGLLRRDREIDDFLMELDLAARDPRNVEQVVDEARQVFRLAVEDVAAPIQVGVVRPDLP